MTTEKQTAANQANAQKSTGPSESGKAAASQNHLLHGLYTRQDYVKPGEHNLYAAFCDTMKSDLAPSTLLEESFVQEITGATWRLRRCSAVEGELADYREQDPLLDEKADKTIRSIERARAAAHAQLNRSINQLRKLQTERVSRIEIDWATLAFPPIADTRHVQSALSAQYRLDQQMRDLKKEAESAESAQVEQALEAIMNDKMASNCKPATPQPTPIAKVGRNAKCPCRSGKKFKQCCIGKAA